MAAGTASVSGKAGFESVNRRFGAVRQHKQRKSLKAIQLNCTK